MADETENKWKVPAWQKPGVRAVVAYGRKFPRGVTGTIQSTHSTGHGAQARFIPDAIPSGWPESWASWDVAVLNLDPV